MKSRFSSRRWTSSLRVALSDLGCQGPRHWYTEDQQFPTIAVVLQQGIPEALRRQLMANINTPPTMVPNFSDNQVEP